MKKRIINAAIQVLPMAKDGDMYSMVDEAIKEIAESGLKYKVTPFETVVEGTYEAVMQLVERVHDACYKAGAENMLCNLKIQSHSVKDVAIEDKIGKYES